jgi:hypothetical protein
VLLDIPNGDVTEELAGDILDTTAPAEKAGIEVGAGGNLGSVLSKSPTESSEVVGLLAAMLILALPFGSLVAMGSAHHHRGARPGHRPRPHRPARPPVQHPPRSGRPWPP